ncbi:MAG: ArnT family glycosyltransferase [Chloroflexia bacterium]
MDSAVHIVKTGDLNPHLYIWPSLVIYIQALIYKLNLLWGTWRGYYVGPESLPDHNHIFALAPELYLWGRTFSALVGATAVAGVYHLGAAIFGRPAGIVAGLLLLTSPLHVEYSHYLVTDVTMGACGLLALAAAWHLVERPGARAALLAGAAVGLAAAAKYNGLYAAIPVGLAWLLAFRSGFGFGRRLAVALGMVLAGGIVFLLANPYVLLDWRDWSRGFVFQVNAYLPATNLEQAGTAFAKQLGMLWETDAVFLAAGAMGGLILLVAAVHNRRTDPRLARAATLILPFPPLYILLMARFTEVYERNLIITLPFLALAAGYAAAAVARWLWGEMAADVGGQRTQFVTHFAFYALAILLVAESARVSVNFDLYMAATESRNQAAAWLAGELRAGHRAAVELHPLQTCAPAPWSCPEPDVFSPNVQLTHRPPSWYAAHGYDYVMLVGKETALLGSSEETGRRAGGTLAPYLSLPLVRLFDGDDEGGKGPTVRVFRTAPSPPTIAVATRSGVRFGGIAELWGYALAPLTSTATLYDPASDRPSGPYRPGGAVGVHLYWRALPAAPATPGNWTVALHLLDSQGKIAAQLDPPLISSGRSRPVREWYTNEFLDSAYNLALPDGIPPGTYRLTLTLYDAPNGPALAVQPPGMAPTALDLGPISAER